VIAGNGVIYCTRAEPIHLQQPQSFVVPTAHDHQAGMVSPLMDGLLHADVGYSMAGLETCVFFVTEAFDTRGGQQAAYNDDVAT
jgi:hypothetical protein